MTPAARRLFLALVLAQAAHSLEEYVFRLWDVLAPARFVANALGLDPALGFAIANSALVAFGLWCYFARVRPGRPSARAFAWGWAVVEAANGIGHLLLAKGANGYFPGAATAPILLVLAVALWVTLSGAPGDEAGAEAALAPITEYFTAGYDEKTFNAASCQGNEPSEEDLAAFEQECGFRLPPDFRAFTVSPLGGLYMEAREEVWPRAEMYAVGPFWSFLYAVKVFGIARDIPEWLDLRVQYAEMKAEGFGHLVPFLQVQGDADKYCFDAAGRIVCWRHETPEEPEVEPITFAALVVRELRALEERARRKARGEDLTR
jgi:SMI1/KNR4 family protein SUKH-1/uncharacterized protein with HXXEE motif